MNEDEQILRNYIFHFLRSEDYKTDVNFYLPNFLTNDPAFAETQRTLSWEHEQYRLKIIDFAKQFHPQTATWGLSSWEEELGLPVDLSADLELRRAKVLAKLLGASPMTVENTNKLVNLFTNDGKAYVDELPEDGVIKVIIPSKTAHIDAMRDSLDEMLPAHLAYDFQHVIHIDDNDKDDDNGKPDVIVDISDTHINDLDSDSFFMHAEFPLSENVPYGKYYDALRYDGSIKAKSPNQLNGNLQYDGFLAYNGIATDTSTVAEPCRWWLIPTGDSTFNKEFKHNGSIKFDGLRPQDIEFDDGMDELSDIEVDKVIEDTLSISNQYDGIHKFDNDTEANTYQIPADMNGTLELNRFKRFNGKACYNGGDINYFNGAIKADGKFDFEGNGFKARIETFTDDLSGKLSSIKNQKETPLSNYAPEISDFVPLIIDKQLNIINTDGIHDDIKDSYDDCNKTAICKAIRFNGLRHYNGGDVNYFNGSIKADGQFDFEGNGNRAKMEIIAIDLDNSFSFKQSEKSVPPNYIEQFDIINKILDKHSLYAQIAFTDNAEPVDNGGDLIIRRSLRYTGCLNYRGNFECVENSRKRFNGNMNYNGVYRLALNGTEKFNGVECYGGRKNLKYTEHLDSINGEFRIIDSRKLPIATREKRGFIIVGSNINIDNSGKITLSNKLTSPIAEMDSGKLRTILKNKKG